MFWQKGHLKIHLNKNTKSLKKRKIVRNLQIIYLKVCLVFPVAFLTWYENIHGKVHFQRLSRILFWQKQKETIWIMAVSRTWKILFWISISPKLCPCFNFCLQQICICVGWSACTKKSLIHAIKYNQIPSKYHQIPFVCNCPCKKTSPNLKQYVDLFQFSFSSFSLIPILRILILSANNRFNVLEAARPRHLGKPFDEHQFVLHRKKIIEKQLENMTLYLSMKIKSNKNNEKINKI